MGVRVDPIESRFEGVFEVVMKPEKPVGIVIGRSTTGYVFDGRFNDSFKAANMLLSKGVTIQRIDEARQVE